MGVEDIDTYRIQIISPGELIEQAKDGLEDYLRSQGYGDGNWPDWYAATAESRLAQKKEKSAISPSAEVLKLTLFRPQGEVIDDKDKEEK